MKQQHPCSLCGGRKKLWLGGKDYLECPDCDGTGIVTYDVTKVRKTERVTFIAGSRPIRTLTNRIIKATTF
jgi:hypothetical protein